MEEKPLDGPEYGMVRSAQFSEVLLERSDIVVDQRSEAQERVRADQVLRLRNGLVPGVGFRELTKISDNRFIFTL